MGSEVSQIKKECSPDPEYPPPPPPESLTKPKNYLRPTLEPVIKLPLYQYRTPTQTLTLLKYTPKFRAKPHSV